MADGQSMTVADVVAQTMDGRLEDFVREAVALVARELMDGGDLGGDRRGARRGRARDPVDASQRVSLAGVGDEGRGDRAVDPEEASGRRTSRASGAAAALGAGDRRGRAGGVCERRESTRKVDRLVEQLGIDGMTKDRVSALCRALDEQVELFRQRPLEGAYPYLWLDAKQVKVRDHGRVVSKALVVAYAVHESGVRR